MSSYLKKRSSTGNIDNNADWFTILLSLAIMAFGVLCIYSAEYEPDTSSGIEWTKSHGKQIIWIGLIVFLGFIIFLTQVTIFDTFGFVFYAAGIALMIITLFIGKTVAGAKGWLDLGGFQIQSAEIAKFTTAIAISKLVATDSFTKKKLSNFILASAIIGLPIIIILLQNDTGSALVFLSFFLLLYVNGLNGLFILIPIFSILVALLVLIFNLTAVIIGILLVGILLYFILNQIKYRLLLVSFAIGYFVFVSFSVSYVNENILQKHQKERIEVLIGKKNDPKGAGYNINQSLIAIGSGGLWGKGFLNGTQTKFKFVPEQSTDFIFCTVGEEFGFVGAALLLIAYFLLIYRIFLSSKKFHDPFHRNFSISLAGILFFHLIINICMTIGLFPIIGIPLPFMSYGGSSLFTFGLMLGIYLKITSVAKRIEN